MPADFKREWRCWREVLSEKNAKIPPKQVLAIGDASTQALPNAGAVRMIVV
jgi:hypothetical protein